MECLWDKAPQTVTQIAKAMENKTGWAKSTTKTLISLMEAKRYLRYEEGGAVIVLSSALICLRAY